MFKKARSGYNEQNLRFHSQEFKLLDHQRSNLITFIFFEPFDHRAHGAVCEVRVVRLAYSILDDGVAEPATLPSRIVTISQKKRLLGGFLIRPPSAIFGDVFGACQRVRFA